MAKRVIIPLHRNDVAPRFDLATEVKSILLGDGGEHLEEKNVVLQESSAEKLCHLILTEAARVVICGGIEEEYFRYLEWKGIEVLDGVMGPADEALDRLVKGTLKSGANLFQDFEPEAAEGAV
ncbi:MAG: NifB/NifX family molybdenum-iron cluster-binding protein [Desulfobacteraceae bacterium]